MTIIFLLIACGLLTACYWNGRLIGPGLACTVWAVWLWPHLAPHIQ